mgnify:CR=1 FL=1
MIEVISYKMRAEDPVWPGNPPVVQLEPQQSISGGDVANTTAIRVFSHSGSHLDSPKHFNDKGPAAAELDVGKYVFERPRVISVPKSDGEAITKEELSPHADKIADADLLCFRTGWSVMRKADPQRYVQTGPLLAPEGAQYLIDNFPNLRALAIDAVSIGSADPALEKDTVATHQILLGTHRDDDRYLLILEDLVIDEKLENAIRIYAWPLWIEGSDGSPCTFVAEYPD